MPSAVYTKENLFGWDEAVKGEPKQCTGGAVGDRIEVTAEDPSMAGQTATGGGNADAGATEDKQDLEWTVVHFGPVNVRQAKNLRSRTLGSKASGARVRGRRDGEWLELLGEPGFMRVGADFCPFLLRTVEVGGQYKQLRAMAIFDELERELQAAIKEPAAAKPTVTVPGLRLPPATPAVAAETAAGSGSGEHAPFMTVSLREGDAEPMADAAAREWLRRARAWLQRLDPRATVPPSSRLPRVALDWEPAAAVLFVLTQGHFDPHRDVPELGARPEGGKPGLVSVCSSTSDRRRSFHPLIYENFAKQTHEPRELVVVHTGELPSEFFTEKAREDPRVVYRFFPVTREAPGSPRLSDEQAGSTSDAVLQEDDPGELTHWGSKSPWKYELCREGWTKGLKRNVAACIARGSVIAHFDDGCLYGADYLARMYRELAKGRGGATSAGQPAAGAISLARWYSLGIADTEFRLVDMRKPEPLWESFGQNPREGQEGDQYNHGFAFAYMRSAWHQQPFPDVEAVGARDGDFMAGLKAQGVLTRLVDPSAPEAMAACGWHRDATCGSKDAPANVNHSQVLSFMAFRGTEVAMPKMFGKLVPLVREIASDLSTRRERYLRDLVEEHGSLQVCGHCNFPVALTSSLQGAAKRLTTSMQATDGYDMTISHETHEMKFDTVEFSKAGGAVAEGHWQPPPAGHSWLSGIVQRMAICRNCGFQLGWRYEAPGDPKEFASPADVFQALPPRGPVSWSFIARHLRERRKPGEFVPEENDHSRHRETVHNRGRSTVCPEGHPLRCFSTGQGNGGALPHYYICDVCDRPARGAQHLWGCGTCDYDICEPCRTRRGA